jgi:hypothetical protein
MNFGTAVRVLIGILGTILLGAIGSGFWERVLSPFLSYLSGILTTALSNASKRYSDSLYTSAANLYNPGSTQGFVIVLAFFFSCWVLLNAIRSKRENKLIERLHQSITAPYRGWFGIAYFGAAVVVMVFMMARQETIEKIQGYSYQQMEIVRPFVGEQKYFRLRSSYFNIKTKEDFNRFLVDLYGTSKAVGLVVEPFALK